MSGTALPPQHVGDMTVTVQQGWSARLQAASRWAYAIDRPGEAAFVSNARYRTPQAAMNAGVRDANACLGLDDFGDPLPTLKPYTGDTGGLGRFIR